LVNILQDAYIDFYLSPLPSLSLSPPFLPPPLETQLQAALTELPAHEHNLAHTSTAATQQLYTQYSTEVVEAATAE
jgi:hypothetical protein